MNKSFAQIENYIYDCSGKGDSCGNEILSYLSNIDSSKNIFLLSESNHRLRSLDSIRTHLINQIVNHYNPEKVFYENTPENDLLLKDYYAGKFHYSIFPDSLLERYDNTIASDSLVLANTIYNYFFKNAIAYNYINDLVGIDVGTQSIRLGLWNLCIRTKNLNLKKDSIINNFCDSIMRRYQIEYNAILETPDNDEKFSIKNERIKKFMSAVDTSIQNPFLTLAWNSLFASYYQVHANRNLSFPVALGNARQLTSKEFFHKNSYRDSVMYHNFTQLLPEKWNNIVLSFSTFHLMDTRNTNEFLDVLDSSSNTLGRYLHNNFRPYLRRIAFVCYDADLKLKGDNNEHKRESLEYKLAQKYDMAYVDLYSYRHSEGEKKPFYMRPTFFNYRKLNWENLFDGIVFTKDCGCKD